MEKFFLLVCAALVGTFLFSDENKTPAPEKMAASDSQVDKNSLDTPSPEKENPVLAVLPETPNVIATAGTT